MCPACTVLDQRSLVVQQLGLSVGPLFPTPAGTIPAKAAVVAAIKEGAARLHLELFNSNGTEKWGGHALRRGGAQFLGAAGVDVWRIQALARHSSNAILGYLQDSHLASLSNVALEAALQRDLSQLRAEVTAMRAQARAVAEQVVRPNLVEPAATSLA